MPTIKLADWQLSVLNTKYDHFCFFGGVATGKSFTGSQFVIKMVLQHPHLTGFIGANDYNQLSQVSMRELFYWLSEYGFQFVSDRLPPPEWGQTKKFKDYKNVLSIRNPFTGNVTHIFTRILSDPDALRGLEFSWYWLDETRDTEEYAHDMILARMRESPTVAKGLVTTTTNGDDWVHSRFKPIRGSTMYGSMHVATKRSVDWGIITGHYYRTLLRTYSPLMAEQELFAHHVNVRGGRAYYSAGPWNEKRRAPWGDERPNPAMPLVIGCDFNFQPAPMVWMVGQVGPVKDGKDWSQHIHWFGEISETEISSADMAMRLIQQYPGFFYEMYGDMSGNIGTTSNAGNTDFNQIGITMMENNQQYTLHVEQLEAEESRQNPRVKDRIENMNAKLRNAIGETTMTYNPDTCPHFHGDMKMVGWKKNVNRGQGKLDDHGDYKRTHASDGAGYAVWKKFPPGRRAFLLPSVQSINRPNYQRQGSIFETL